MTNEKRLWSVQFQDAMAAKTGVGPIEGCNYFLEQDFDLALNCAYREWRRTDYRHVRVTNADGRAMLVYFPRKTLLEK